MIIKPVSFFGVKLLSGKSWGAKWLTIKLPVSQRLTIKLLAIPVLTMQLLSNSPTLTASALVAISGGQYRPLYLSEDSPTQQVAPFQLDKYPVTNREFKRFLQRHPPWRKDAIASVFAEAPYLSKWQRTDQHWAPAVAQLDSPVTAVSWFAAQAYCQAQNKRLPTVSQWEFVASASQDSQNGSDDPRYNQRILDWYARPSTHELASVTATPANYWGVHAMHGLIWEWTEDFNSALVSGESRADSTIDATLFCGSGASGSADPQDYAAFMRYGFRSSLQAKFTLANLGFRCATEQEQH